MKEAIGKELKVLRIRNDLSLEKVAEDNGLNRETIRRYENGATDLSIERLESLLNYYKVDKIIFFNQACANMQQNDLQLDKEKR